MTLIKPKYLYMFSVQKLDGHEELILIIYVSHLSKYMSPLMSKVLKKFLVVALESD